MATATVIAITGQAWARDEDGNLRELRIGDVLQEGETLITSADGRVELDFADGTGANVVEGGQEVAVTPDLVSDLIVATDASAQDDDLEALLAALDDEEGDLLDILDATAAGGGAGGGGGGGSSFVRVARIAEETDPLSFSTEGGLEGAEFVEFDGGDVAAEDAGEGVVDTTPPTLTVDAPTGNDTTPIITGSSDEIGGTVSVIVTDSAGNTQELEAVVSPDGTWSVDVTTPLAEGDYTVDASITDPAGNGATASDSGAIDTTAPTLTVDAPSGNDTTPTIIGTSDQIGGTVSVIVTDAVGNSQELEATVNPDGTWSVDVTTPLSEGDYTVDASITDPAGNEATASDNGAIDTTAPNAPSVTIANGDDFITADEITNGQVTVTIGLENTNAVAGDTLTVNGTEITLTEEQIAAGEVVTELPTPAEGESLVVTATITDSSGNQSDEGVADAVRDTVVPTIDLAAIGDGNLSVNEAQATELTGTTTNVEDGQVVTLTVTDSQNNTATFTATVTNGAFSTTEDLTAAGLVDGTLTVVADVTDQAGNPASDTESATLQPPASLQVGNNDGNEIVGDGGDDVLIGDRGGKFTIVDPAANYNISLIVDVSGSMSNNSGTPGLSRIELTKQSLVNLSRQLADHEGTINVQLVTFSTNASTAVNIQGLNANNVNQLISAVNTLSASGGTNYQAAFEQSVAWFNAQNVQQTSGEFENLTYFLTDGDPTYSYFNGSLWGNGRDTDYYVMEDSVGEFANLSSISSVNAIGIGGGVNTGLLRFFDNTDIVNSSASQFVSARGYAGTITAPAGDVDIVNTAEDLAAALEGSSEFDELEDLGDDILSGGDGNDIIIGDAINTDHLEWTNGDTGVFFGAGSHDGLGYQGLREYLKWEENGGVTPGDELILGYIRENWETLIDTVRSDGGSNTLNGGFGDDILIGGADNDALIGGEGNDLLYGGAGADTFKWELNDQGSTEQPAIDTVMDFNVGEGDVLDISELLQNEENAADLSTYIVAEEEGADTVLYISSDGNLAGDKENADQVVRLEGKSFSDFGGGSAQDVIQHMLNNDQLKIDQ